jgi:hypothetical protein
MELAVVGVAGHENKVRTLAQIVKPKMNIADKLHSAFAGRDSLSIYATALGETDG